MFASAAPPLEDRLRQEEVDGRGDLDVLLGSLDDPDAPTRSLHQGRIVGADVPVPRGDRVGPTQNRREEALRGLRQTQPIPWYGFLHPPVFRDALDRGGEGGRGNRRA